MYTRQEASLLRQQFWTTFGHYMAPVLSAESVKVNWVNYKTGKQGIAFKMDADSKSAEVAIVLSHADADMRQAHYRNLLALRSLLTAALGEEWVWQQPSAAAHGKVYKQLTDVNIFTREDWPALISFFKAGIISLDIFWEMAQHSFDM